jgi:hypothetical protein
MSKQRRGKLHSKRRKKIRLLLSDKELSEANV